MHNNNIMHRDVKGGNLLLTRNYAVKLTDFDTAFPFDSNKLQTHYHAVGTPYWMAPEMAACNYPEGYVYDQRCDVWSVGILAIEIAEGRPPLFHLTRDRAVDEVLKQPAPTLKHQDKWSKPFKDFLKRCFEKDHEKRAHAKSMLFHPWLKKVNNDRALKDLARNKHFAVQPSDAVMAEMEVKRSRSRSRSIVGTQLVSPSVDLALTRS
eukprot:TRINITY_DN5355_c0_g1_i2.p1 TRINITY_DN5355_c0_g1~~TRINITY_DN5355_c0_g1_i2.p1  ORF type:complete len:208 (+),score=47.67 TRINITY_DN5355_c0_g1_i2:111-734(+)